MDGIRLRTWKADDLAMLWELLFLSLHVRAGDEPFARSVLREPAIAHYVDGFGTRPGDDAVVATDGAGDVVGAAWCRRLGADDPGYGFVADDVPELSMAVLGPWRGRGVGRRLLVDLLSRHPAMSLSVDAENDRAAARYRSLGFVDLDEADGSITMLRRPPVP